MFDTGDKVFVLTNIYYFSYDKSSGEIERYDKVWGLSDVQVDHLAYAPEYNAIIVAYRNTNIDLIIDNNTIINVSDILRKSISGLKEINNIAIRNNFAYFSTTFGIVVFDIEREEFRDTYVIGDNGNQVNVIDVAFVSDSIFALTVQGLKKAPLAGANLANYQNWQNIGLAEGLPTTDGRLIEVVADSIYALFGDTVFKAVNGAWGQYYHQADYTITNIKGTDGQLHVLEHDTTFQGRIGVNNGGTWQYVIENPLNVPTDVVKDNEGVYWVTDTYRGLWKIEFNGNRQVIVPNGPTSSGISGMTYKDGVLWVAPGGATPDWNYSFNDFGFLSLTQGNWGQFNRFNTPELDGVLNIFAVASSPLSDKVYFGSFWDGLLGWDGTSLVQYSKDNSTLEGATGDPARTRIGGLTFDDNGYLWIANHGAGSVLHGLSPNGDMTRMATPPLTFGSASQIVIDDFDQKWVALPQGANQGILVYNHGADVENTADDQYKILTTQLGNGALPSNEVLSLAKDKNGQIWVGTTQGIAIFYCAGSVLTQGCDAQRIIVSRDGFNGYLLENERINHILVDGADRKWVGTNNGLWLFSPDGTEELAYFTEENSPLLSNSVLTLGYDGETGTLYISTDKGLLSLRIEATEGTNIYADPIEVFPNPVRETYSGSIAIRGLPSNAEVRITDITGMMIYQTQALGGQAIWDGRDYTGRKAKTGVYLVFSINEEGTESKPTKLLFIK